MSLISIGKSDFKKVIEDNLLYVDKTLFIKELIERNCDINLITRPKKFGKTLNMSMLKYFFDSNIEYKNLFDGLNISKEKELCNKYQNKYSVIQVSLNNCKGDDWNKCFSGIRSMILQMYKEHAYLLDKLSGSDLQKYNSILEETAEYAQYRRSLNDLIRLIHENLNKEVILLIDEYDVPMEYIQSLSTSDFNKIIAFFKDFLSPVLKEEMTGVYKVVIMGLLRVCNKNLFADLTNLEVSTILENRYADKFGFTADEVKFLLSKFNSKVTIEEMREWYSGYNIGKFEIYNPWSTVNAIKLDEIGIYWANTKGNDLLWSIIDSVFSQAKDLLAELIIYGVVEDKYITQDTPLINIRSDEINLWTVLLFYGYVTKERKVDSDRYDLKMPNKEIKSIFRDFIIRLTYQHVKNISDIHKAIYADDYRKFSSSLRIENLEKTLSCLYIKNEKYRDHIFIFGILTALSNCEVVSKKEMKYGRCDIWMKNNITGKEYIFSLKRAGISQASRMLEEAIKEIEDKYSKDNEVKIGILFYKEFASAQMIVKEGGEFLIGKMTF